jgi:NAD(P)-dependent dehydrogenase (short-subunit alcohol dehydrogenase family)
MKTIIVTGASRGIGAAIVRSLRARGCHVIGVSRSRGPLEELSMEKIGPGSFDFVAGDVCEEATLKAALDMAVSNGRKLDGLVLNAG